MESNPGFNDLIGEVHRGNLTVFKGLKYSATDIITRLI
jgi:hypothetical protein